MPTAKLVIHDEVNIKFENVDPATRRKLSASVKFMLPYAYHMPAYKLGRWDGMIRFCDVGGRTYLNLLDTLLPILQQSGYELDIEDHRQQWNFEFDQIDENVLSDIKWPKGHVNEGESIVLRDYQVDVVNNSLSHLQSLQEVATGAGKTIITATLSKLVGKYGRSIVIVPNKSLVTQTEEDYINVGLDVGVFYGDRKEFGRQHTICTWQSLNVLLKKSKKKIAKIDIQQFIEGVVCVMVDECFDGNTLITTPFGKIPIKNIKKGDIVINFDEQKKIYKEDIVASVHTNLINNLAEEMLELQFDNGQIIKVTANHKFLTDVGWIRADELTEKINIIDINTYN
jgi:hypothetical protein